MRVFVTYDGRGTITSIGSLAPEFADCGGVMPAPRQRVCALDVADIVHPGQFERYVREFVVDLRSEPLQLVRRKAGRPACKPVSRKRP